MLNQMKYLFYHIYPMHQECARAMCQNGRIIGEEHIHETRKPNNVGVVNLR